MGISNRMSGGRDIKLLIKRVLYRRQSRLFCVGTPKSGTKSLASLFSLPSCHELDDENLIRLILNNAPEADLQAYLKQREKWHKYDIDSSQLNAHLIGAFLSLYPDAKFVLPIRDCISWLDSLIDHSLTNPANQLWHDYRSRRFGGKPTSFPKEEQVLQKHDLYTLDGYFQYWQRHNQSVIETVPSDKLLIVKTSELSERVDDIAKFAGISAVRINRHSTRVYTRNKKHHLLNQIPQAYLHHKAITHCNSLMAEFFPEIELDR